jgi:NTP pyrophosphatase (non-canonical NTP hydrolase)
MSNLYVTMEQSLKELSDGNKEVLLITQEECAEVIQAISKVFRFGVSDSHNGKTNQAHLEEELGDLLCMIEILTDRGFVDNGSILTAKAAKYNKLRKWSNIFGEKE